MTQQADGAPVAKRSRPVVPGNNIATGEAGMLDWSQVEAWPANALIYWLGPATADGDPPCDPHLGSLGGRSRLL
ncbi:MAG: hypothetical protein M3Z04_08415 [Chloroflexota bacterium]|nr:hypothetical protein [Chloroflexota bacterium]